MQKWTQVALVTATVQREVLMQDTEKLKYSREMKDVTW